MVFLGNPGHAHRTPKRNLLQRTGFQSNYRGSAFPPRLGVGVAQRPVRDVFLPPFALHLTGGEGSTVPGALVAFRLLPKTQEVHGVTRGLRFETNFLVIFEGKCWRFSGPCLRTVDIRG